MFYTHGLLFSVRQNPTKEGDHDETVGFDKQMHGYTQL
jgi:hypothetical protein